MDATIKFTLIRYNSRRKLRGAEAAEYRIQEAGTPHYFLWMSLADIKRNILEFGPHEELLRGVKCYKKNKFVTKDNEEDYDL